MWINQIIQRVIYYRTTALNLSLYCIINTLYFFPRNFICNLLINSSSLCFSLIHLISSHWLNLKLFKRAQMFSARIRRTHEAGQRTSNHPRRTGPAETLWWFNKDNKQFYVHNPADWLNPHQADTLHVTLLQWCKHVTSDYYHNLIIPSYQIIVFM